MMPAHWGYVGAAYGIAWGVLLLYTWHLQRALAAARRGGAQGEDAPDAT